MIKVNHVCKEFVSAKKYPGLKGAIKGLFSSEKVSKTAVDDISFDIAEILLETEQGMLNVKGKDLHVNRLNLEKGEVDIEGIIDTLSYSQVPSSAKKTENVFGKWFK